MGEYLALYDIFVKGSTHQAFGVYIIVDISEVGPPVVGAPLFFNAHSCLPQWSGPEMVKESSIKERDQHINGCQSYITMDISTD